MTTFHMEADTQQKQDISVLHVDDREAQCDLLSTYLEKLAEEISVTTTTDPTTVLERVERDRVDCIVCDYQMPEMDGIEVLRSVRDHYPNLPFFLFTGKGSEDVASEAVDAGVTSYVQKGGNEVYEQLVNRITSAMERLESERLAQVTHERLLSLYEQTDGFYILDEEFAIRYWNNRISERVGLARADVLGRHFWDVFPEARDTAVYGHFTRAMNERTPVEFDIKYEPHDYWAEVRVYPVEPGLFVHSRDITEEKDNQTELERRNKILQSFAHTVSHDLRNPLTIAEGNLRLAQETGDFEHLEEVAQAHNRMRNLIDELLRLSRGGELNVESVSVSSAAQNAWKTVTSDDVELILDGDMTVEADTGQLQRLFENLFWNAIDHGEASTIRVGPVDGRGFYIEDDGVGIPVEDRERVFESGYTTADTGSGYGLSIVGGIVELHEWAVSVTDSSDGGARFEIVV
ncbi:response regulator [Haloarcula onubensis]|uniref:histidine kinase n=1 Tax=Haloarcula onubensis TaxID=2950539 RepID=A0ABU2FKB8_9EURY|nr:response regulator [Halomicroarcula sp. S3CR25-11]MDS0280702.1 response regulator [Halomicroarcula sp. S3CR25-11]